MKYSRDQCPQHLDRERGREKDYVIYGKILGMKLRRTRSTKTQEE
jgi:ribosome biogenesis SPOUT family RNA methylase Rps3